MASLSLTWKPSPQSLALHSRKACTSSLRSRYKRIDVASQIRSSSSVLENSLSRKFRFSAGNERLVKTKNNGRGFSAVCYSAPLSACNLRWISAVSSALLILSKGTAIQKPFLIPLFAIQAPASIIAWIRGEYGIWTAFLALLVRLFFFIPRELELPFLAILLVIVAPFQAIKLRGTQEGAIISLAIVGYLAFQHFSRAGSLRKAFDQGSVMATTAIICITTVSFLLLI